MLWRMPRRCIIDGNNLLHAVRDHAPVPAGGREAMVRRIHQWSVRDGYATTVVFDGAPPTRGLKRQTAPDGLEVRFSAPRTADDLIVELIHAASHPDQILVVTDDKAILYEARLRRCASIANVTFIEKLFPSSPNSPAVASIPPSDKPTDISPEELAYWRREFGIPDAKDEPFEGMEGMRF